MHLANFKCWYETELPEEVWQLLIEEYGDGDYIVYQVGSYAREPESSSTVVTLDVSFSDIQWNIKNSEDEEDEENDERDEEKEGENYSAVDAWFMANGAENEELVIIKRY